MRINSFFYEIKNLFMRGRNMKLSSAKIRAYARTISAGLRTIYEVEESYRVAVYIELIATCNWTLEDVEAKYLEAVKSELGIIEATK